MFRKVLFICIRLYLLLLPIFALCQEERDNVIEIHKFSNPDVIFSILKDEGFAIKYNSDLKEYDTQPKKINDSVTVWLQIVSSKKTIMLTGMVRVNDTTTTPLNNLGNKEWYRTIEYNTSGDEIMKQAFDKIYMIAKKTGGRIKFHRMLSCFG